MLYLASDHGGFNLKEDIKKFLTKKKVEFVDLGPHELNPADDYPDFATLVAAKVSANPVVDTGILFCRSGQGVNIVANKFPHVRAALVWNTKEAQVSRTDDLVNVVSLPSDYIKEGEAENIVKVWLDTPMGSEERHLRRVKKIEELEETLYK